MTRTATAIDRPSCPSIEVRRFQGQERPSDLLELRRCVWEQETGLLREEELFNENDVQGVHILVYDAADDQRLIASTCAVEAERSDFAAHTRLPAEVLRDTMLSTRSTVHPDYRRSGLFSLLVYLGAREARMGGRRWLAAYLEREASPGRKIADPIDLDKVPPRRVQGRHGSYEVVATAGDVAQTMLKCFRRIPEDLHPYLRRHCFVEEVVAEVMRGAKRFYQGPWFEAVSRGRLTRWQYFKTLADMHLYVRWTTRLLGAVIGITPQPDLRRHFIQHLGGEIDHEVMLENDIAHLGFDVDYVKHDMSASENIRAFMSLQESLCTGPRRDPFLFIAVPFAVEALTAFVTQEFLGQLSANVASWGVSSPDRAMTFITSHTRSDGGTDGHWEAARKILPNCLKGEKELQEFLSIVRLAQDLLDRSFTANAQATDIYSASPM